MVRLLTAALLTVGVCCADSVTYTYVDAYSLDAQGYAPPSAVWSSPGFAVFPTEPNAADPLTLVSCYSGAVPGYDTSCYNAFLNQYPEDPGHFNANILVTSPGNSLSLFSTSFPIEDLSTLGTFYAASGPGIFIVQDPPDPSDAPEPASYGLLAAGLAFVLVRPKSKRGLLSRALHTAIIERVSR